MINNIRHVAILGSGGTMGSLTGGIIAQSGIKVYFLSRTENNAKFGLERAIAQARSEVISQNIICGEYKELFKDALETADWIVECVSENIEIKQNMYERIEQYRQPGAIVSTMTSSLPLLKLCQGRSDDFKKNFLGIHFYNPPSKLVACEIAPQYHTNPELTEFMKNFLEQKLGRVVIPVYDTAGYAGNRNAFLLFSEITALAEQHGVEMIDYLLGPYTGRIMAPLATIDLIGLDIYQAIIESLYKHTNDHMHDSFKLPKYLKKMIDNGHLGNKTPNKGGFYKRDVNKNKFVINPETLEYAPIQRPTLKFVEEAKNMIHLGRYRDAFDIIKKAPLKEADIVKRILCTYIVYSYSCIGKVTGADYGIDGIDKVMAFGYNWVPPSQIVSMLRGPKVVIKLLKEYGLSVPPALENARELLDPHLNSGRYFLSR
ncbi:MAG: 3-hydroxyacyl-CoA dehydrogenase family protein [bacterium]